MKWTHERPTKPGKYLLAHANGAMSSKSGFGLQVVKQEYTLSSTPYGELLKPGSAKSVAEIHKAHWWLGPLPDVPQDDTPQESPAAHSEREEEEARDE